MTLSNGQNKKLYKVRIMKKKNEEETNMGILRDLLNKLINDNKITFSFYNNSLLDLDLIQICYNETNDTIELEFRDVMGEYLEELKKIINNKTQAK